MVTVVTQGFRYELAPTQAQVRTLRHYCSVYRQVYNRYISAKRSWWEENKGLPKILRRKTDTSNGMSREITAELARDLALPAEARCPKLAAIRSAPRHLVTYALQTADLAYGNWFASGKDGAWTKPPRFKSAHDPKHMRFSMQVQTTRADLAGGRSGVRPFQHSRGFTLTKLGLLRAKEPTAKLKGRPTHVTISEHAGRWYISVTCLEVPREVPDRTDTERVGVDLGVRKLATLSTGEFIAESPEVLAGMTRAEKRIKRLQRSMSRKENEARANGCWDKYATSKGYQRVKRKFQVAHAKAARQRLDRSHKLTTRLVKEFRTVVIEDLSVQSMLRSAKGTVEKPGKNVRQKAGLNRSVARKCFGAIRRQLEYKAKWYGATVETVPRFYSSSKTCSSCGNVKQDLGSKETYHCDACGLTIDRDLNAAINIRDFSPEAQEKLVAKTTGERVDCPKRASGSRAGLKGRKTTKPEKHVQDPQGKPDAGLNRLCRLGQTPTQSRGSP